MAGKESWLKVSLKTGSFGRGLQQMEGMAKGAGKTMGVLISKPIKAGFREGVQAARASMGEMKKEFSNLADKAKEKFAFAATLGGAVSFGALVKSAMEGQQAYTELGIAMSKASGSMVTTAQAQTMVENAARRTKQEVDALVKVGEELKDVGAEKFEESLVRSQMQAKRLQLDGSMIANIYKTLLTKGLASSAEQAEILVERIASIDDDKLNADIIREFATQMGVAGGNAEQMLNVIEKVSPGVKDFKAASEVVKQFGQSFGSAKGLNELTKAAGVGKIKFDQNATAFENFYDVVQTGGEKSQAVIKAFYKTFGNEKSQKMLEMLMGKELMIKVQQGKATKLEMQEAALKLKDLYIQQHDTEQEKARIQKADAELLNTSEAKYQDALNRLTMAFRKPEMIEAIDKIASKLPQFAEGIASLVSWVTDHPAESIAALVAGRVGLGMTQAFASAAIQKAGEQGMSMLFRSIMTANAASMAATGAGGAAKGVLGSMGMGAAGAGVGAKTAGMMAASTALGVLGAGAAGAAVGYGIYKHGGMEEGQNAEFDAQRVATQAVTDAGMAKSPDQIREALTKLQQARTGLNENRSMTNDVFGGMASMLTDEKSPAEMRASKDREITYAQQMLVEQFKVLAAAAAKAGKSLGDASDTTRGPMRAANPTPGARPVGG